MKPLSQAFIAVTLLLFPLLVIWIAYHLEGEMGTFTLAAALGYLGGLILSVRYFANIFRILIRMYATNKAKDDGA